VKENAAALKTKMEAEKLVSQTAEKLALEVIKEITGTKSMTE